MNKFLLFDESISRQKPNTVLNGKASCPFCDPANLVDILAQQDKFLWLKNKYPVNLATNQTVILETDNCEEGIPDYSLEYFTELLVFTLAKLNEMEKSGLYKSVILFKNHGSLSGGSIKHSHMQIVGLEEVDYREGLAAEYFCGLKAIEDQHGIEVNIAQRPMLNFTEFNIIKKQEALLKDFAYYLQQTVTYVYASHLRQEVSFNLFFYTMNERLIARVVPRYPVSPYYVGYKIEQIHVASKLIKVQEELALFIEGNTRS